jgi:hypothetical protein
MDKEKIGLQPFAYKQWISPKYTPAFPQIAYLAILSKTSTP